MIWGVCINNMIFVCLNCYVCRFTIAGRVVGAVGGEGCSHKNGGPANVNVELLSPTGDVVSSVSTSSAGSYSFTNIIPGLKFPSHFLIEDYCIRILCMM